MKYTHWSALALTCILSALGCSRSQSSVASATPPVTTGNTEQAHDDLRRVSIEELAGMIERHDQVAIIDNNGRERYEQGHVPGARWVGHDAVTAEVLPPDHGARLVFYCANEH
jgi:3-mercaptopyruvate sulfurtransferase SseA